jgi:hypothetical protein
MSDHDISAENTPKYRQLNPRGFFAEDDTLYPEDTEFYYTGTPNEFMEPLNEPAKAAMRAYLAELDWCADQAAIANGRRPRGRVSDMAEQISDSLKDATRASKEFVMPASSRNVPMQGNMPRTPGQARAPGRPKKLTGAVQPSTEKVRTEPHPISSMGRSTPE